MDNSDSSDTSDEDYIPNEGEVVSEEEESGDEEHFVPDEDDDGADNKESVSISKRPKKPRKIISSDPCTKRNRKVTTKRTRQRSLEADEECNDKQFEAKNDEVKEEAKKNKADSLWTDFMKDVGTIKTKPKPSSDPVSSKASDSTPASSASLPTPSSSTSATTKSNKVTVIKEYDFAGETVVVTKELDINSKEAKQALSSSALKTEPRPAATPSSSSSEKPASATLKRPPGGLSSVLNKLNKKPKMSTLEKSKLDWDGFKQKEGITEELQIHNRGKEGYLERVAFLERTDQRQYEIERNLRLGSSQKQ